MIRKILYFAFTSLVWADGIDYNAAITVNYGDSYDFYSYTENRFDLNLFYNNVIFVLTHLFSAGSIVGEE